jgi:hypothetical protein
MKLTFKPSAVGELEKGRKAVPVGTVRDVKGTKYKQMKTATGWIHVKVDKHGNVVQDTDKKDVKQADANAGADAGQKKVNSNKTATMEETAKVLGVTATDPHKIEQSVKYRINLLGYADACSRCGGTGNYSYNQITGTTCFKCNGNGKQMPKLTGELIAKLKADVDSGRLAAAQEVKRKEKEAFDNAKALNEKIFDAWGASEVSKDYDVGYRKHTLKLDSELYKFNRKMKEIQEFVSYLHDGVSSADYALKHPESNGSYTWVPPRGGSGVGASSKTTITKKELEEKMSAYKALLAEEVKNAVPNIQRIDAEYKKWKESSLGKSILEKGRKAEADGTIKDVKGTPYKRMKQGKKWIHVKVSKTGQVTDMAGNIIKQGAGGGGNDGGDGGDEDLKGMGKQELEQERDRLKADIQKHYDEQAKLPKEQRKADSKLTGRLNKVQVHLDAMNAHVLDNAKLDGIINNMLAEIDAGTRAGIDSSKLGMRMAMKRDVLENILKNKGLAETAPGVWGRAPAPAKKRGRPAGSKNKPKVSNLSGQGNNSSGAGQNVSTGGTPKTAQGRPQGDPKGVDTWEEAGVKKIDPEGLAAIVRATTKRDRMAYGQEVVYKGDYHKGLTGKKGKLVAFGEKGFALVSFNGEKPVTCAWRDTAAVGMIQPNSIYDGLTPDNVYRCSGKTVAKMREVLTEKIGNTNVTYLDLCREFQNAGFPLYVVGGMPRDALMGKASKDVDFIIDGTERDLEDVMKKNHPTWHITSGKHGLRQFKDHGADVDFTPIHKFSPEMQDMASGWSMKDDAAARDLSMNTLQYNPLTNILIDATGKGLDDIKNNTASFAGPHLLEYAPQNVLRIVKFMGRGYKVSDATMNTFKDSLKYVKTLPSARIAGFMHNQIGKKDGEKGLLKFKDIMSKHDPQLWRGYFEKMFNDIIPIYRGK